MPSRNLIICNFIAQYIYIYSTYSFLFLHLRCYWRHFITCLPYWNTLIADFFREVLRSHVTQNTNELSIPAVASQTQKHCRTKIVLTTFRYTNLKLTDDVLQFILRLFDIIAVSIDSGGHALCYEALRCLPLPVSILSPAKFLPLVGNLPTSQLNGTRPTELSLRTITW
jgi:hypothetical protein